MLPTVSNPELFFGICSPIGNDNKTAYDLLKQCLQKYQYKCEYFKVTDLMRRIKIKDHTLIDKPFDERYASYIKYANHLRETTKLQDIMASLCCSAAQKFRTEAGGKTKQYIPKTAYFFDQFKRKEEIDLLRQIYGRQFVVISLYSDPDKRKRQIAAKIQSDHSAARIANLYKSIADDLVAQDQKEEDNKFGQRLEDAFPSADLFLDLDDQKQAQILLTRFLDGLFGSNSVSPTKDEYSINYARNAALQSLDLSRQVGAALFTKDGEIITSGCNEVPKALGNVYGADDEKPIRDAEKGEDSNERIKKSMLVDFTKKLSEIGLLKETLSNIEIEQFITSETARNGRLRNAQLMDLLEFGRMVHAEMGAICEAARLGRSIHGATLYCTTFPCHLCTKLIIASGVVRVVYIEPYPKSYAEEFHREEIHLGRMRQGDKVTFEPFIGISPCRYQTIFSRGRRKDDNGKFVQWTNHSPHPITKITDTFYLHNETAAIAQLNEVLSRLQENGTLTVDT